MTEYTFTITPKLAAIMKALGGPITRHNPLQIQRNPDGIVVEGAEARMLVLSYHSPSLNPTTFTSFEFPKAGDRWEFEGDYLYVRRGLIRSSALDYNLAKPITYENVDNLKEVATFNAKTLLAVALAGNNLDSWVVFGRDGSMWGSDGWRLHMGSCNPIISASGEQGETLSISTRLAKALGKFAGKMPITLCASPDGSIVLKCSNLIIDQQKYKGEPPRSLVPLITPNFNRGMSVGKISHTQAVAIVKELRIARKAFGSWKSTQTQQYLKFASDLIRIHAGPSVEATIRLDSAIECDATPEIAFFADALEFMTTSSDSDIELMHNPGAVRPIVLTDKEDNNVALVMPLIPKEVK